MISDRSHTKEWITRVREDFPGKDPILIEKMIMALTLVENLGHTDLDFVFKGGTSLLLLLGSLHRFSIDIDIVLPNHESLEEYLQTVVEIGPFTRFEENKRPGELPKQHFKLFFHSVIQEKESHILLDILFEKNLYPKLIPVDVQSPVVSIEGGAFQVICPSAECLLGDKLTAFAPHTTGIPYEIGKELEIAKQLYDVATLFDIVDDMELVSSTFHKIAPKELAYRGMDRLSSEDVLWDTFHTSILIGTRGSTSEKEFEELANGFKKMSSFIFSGSFTVDTAVLCASKAAYLSALILRGIDLPGRFDKGLDLSDWTILNTDYNKLNKVKKTSPEAFFYFCHALRVLEILE